MSRIIMNHISKYLKSVRISNQLDRVKEKVYLFDVVSKAGYSLVDDTFVYASETPCCEWRVFHNCGENIPVGRISVRSKYCARHSAAMWKHLDTRLYISSGCWVLRTLFWSHGVLPRRFWLFKRWWLTLSSSDLSPDLVISSTPFADISSVDRLSEPVEPFHKIRKS